MAVAAPQPTLWRREGGTLHLDMHPGQTKAWDCERRFIAVIAGTQSGKTSWGPWWLWREIKEHGGGDYLAVSSSFDLFKLKMLPEIRTVFEHVLRSGRYWAGDRIMEIADPATGEFLAKRSDDPMWGRIILRSAAAGGGLESATAKAAWLDEAGQDEFTVESWEAVLRRLALAQGRALITTTPYNVGWLKSSFYDKWTSGDPNYAVIQFPSIQNPSFPREEFERARVSMPDWRFQMFYQGIFSKPAGLIYDCLDELHSIDSVALPGIWPRYVGVDFGGANTALVWLAHDQAADRYFCYSESLSGNVSTRDHAQAAAAKATGTNLVATWGGAKSEEQARRDWSNEGFSIREPPVSDVEAGISRVTRLLKERRLFIFKGLTGLLDEFGTYRRKLDKAGQPTEEIEDKRMYHRLDALRYVCAGLLGTLDPVMGAWAARPRPRG